MDGFELCSPIVLPASGRFALLCGRGQNSHDDMTTKLFSELNLSEELLKAIDKLGFEQAAPIQAQAIPVLMAGRDAVGQSQTGSGKTAAFAIPCD
jgi:superfamily II DNA/RNA helicase